uniref:Uncharacterized protein n=1 Tax=Utricularia reniformis TaxID=192314 RepID=A0A1Y0AZU4_9LAMI|nr:hypothetical protein AEK19_MT0379 [Utricularia reniformis]ART30651.1 hypothetical protein AEK19_MT0379 [Utricularia reniformis]
MELDAIEEDPGRSTSMIRLVTCPKAILKFTPLARCSSFLLFRFIICKQPSSR